MKTIGIIGGISWFSTATYYRVINELTHQRLGRSHSAKILLFSIDFEDFKILLENGDWAGIERMFTDIAIQLQNAGADCIVIATNTVHFVADAIAGQLSIPLLHIADETGKDIAKNGITRVGLIGTKFIMEGEFFINRLTGFGIRTVIPDQLSRDFVHAAVFNELTKGVFKRETKDRFIKIIDQMKADGAEAVIFGCTEFPLLLSPEDISLPVFDTAEIHAKAAVDFALEEMPFTNGEIK